MSPRCSKGLAVRGAGPWQSSGQTAPNQERPPTAATCRIPSPATNWRAVLVVLRLGGSSHPRGGRRRRRRRDREAPLLLARFLGPLVPLEHDSGQDLGIFGDLREERHHLLRAPLRRLQPLTHPLQLLLEGSLLLLQFRDLSRDFVLLLRVVVLVPARRPEVRAAAPTALFSPHDFAQEMPLPPEEPLVRELPPVGIDLLETLRTRNKHQGKKIRSNRDI